MTRRAVFHFAVATTVLLVALATELLSRTTLARPTAFAWPIGFVYGGGWTLPVTAAVLMAGGLRYGWLALEFARRPAATHVESTTGVSRHVVPVSA